MGRITIALAGLGLLGTAPAHATIYRCMSASGAEVFVNAEGRRFSWILLVMAKNGPAEWVDMCVTIGCTHGVGGVVETRHDSYGQRFDPVKRSLRLSEGADSVQLACVPSATDSAALGNRWRGDAPASPPAPAPAAPASFLNGNWLQARSFHTVNGERHLLFVDRDRTGRTASGAKGRYVFISETSRRLFVREAAFDCAARTARHGGKIYDANGALRTTTAEQSDAISPNTPLSNLFNNACFAETAASYPTVYKNPVTAAADVFGRVPKK